MPSAHCCISDSLHCMLYAVMTFLCLAQGPPADCPRVRLSMLLRPGLRLACLAAGAVGACPADEGRQRMERLRCEHHS